GAGDPASATSQNHTEGGNNIIGDALAGAIINDLILITIIVFGFFLVRIYKNKRDSRAIATPGHDSTNNRPLQDPIELVISNQEQEPTSNNNNYNNQQGRRQNFENNLETEIIQSLRQEMTQNLGQYSSNSNNNSSSFNIDENIIDQMKQDILQDIKQELKQSIKNKVMTSFIKGETNIEAGSSKNNK
ncbi:hypothetical protein C1645_831820, partial [Glomus cerebriforme]